jgi:hypothetical protein
MSNEESDIKRVEDAAVALSEFFDSVQIFCTRFESTEGGTVNVVWGEGHWHARYGQVCEWLVKTDERTRRQVQD